MLGSSLNVIDHLTLSNGNVNIDTFGIDIFAPDSAIQGGGANSYVISNGVGYLGVMMSAGASAWTTFPVGTAAHFAPVNLKVNAGSVASQLMDVSVDAGVWSNGASGTDISTNESVVDVIYVVEPDSANSNTNANMQVEWSTAMEVNGFTRAQAYIAHYVNGGWDHSAFVAASAQGGGMYSIERDNISSFSPFAVFDHNTAASVATINSSSNFDIYPNPASNNLVVKNTSGSEHLNMDIMDITGRVLGHYILTEETTSISLQQFSGGNYMIRLYDEHLNMVKKFVKM